MTSNDDGGSLVLEQFVTVFIRGMSDGESGGPDKPDHEFPDDAAVKPAGEFTIHVDDDQTFRYHEASGDPMPIHLDDEFAKSVGLPGIIAHGLCTMAMCSQAVIKTVADGDPARLKRLAVRFASNVFPGNDIVVSMFDAGTDRRPPRLCLRGHVGRRRRGQERLGGDRGVAPARARSTSVAVAPPVRLGPRGRRHRARRRARRDGRRGAGRGARPLRDGVRGRARRVRVWLNGEATTDDAPVDRRRRGRRAATGLGGRGLMASGPKSKRRKKAATPVWREVEERDARRLRTRVPDAPAQGPPLRGRLRHRRAANPPRLPVVRGRGCGRRRRDDRPRAAVRGRGGDGREPGGGGVARAGPATGPVRGDARRGRDRAGRGRVDRAARDRCPRCSPWPRSSPRGRSRPAGRGSSTRATRSSARCSAGLAAAGVVTAARYELGSALALVLFVTAYETGDYIVGSGARNSLEGPIAGCAAIVGRHLLHRRARHPTVRLRRRARRSAVSPRACARSANCSARRSSRPRAPRARRSGGSTRCWCWARCGRGPSAST